MKASIIGATGYTGAELLRLLHGHPAVEIACLTSENQAGKTIMESYPHLRGFYQDMLVSMERLEEIAAQSDVIFIALPHGHAMAVGKKLTGYAGRIIDLGADYRFKDTAVYEEWYKVPHVHPNSASVYGLTELNREKVRQAKIVGNPGCFTTASILALAPLVQYELIDLESIVVDAKSGLTGAGRSLALTSHFSEAHENVQAYNIGKHRHTPEIETALGELAGEKVTLNFTPHLIPMGRGILSTCYARLKSGINDEAVGNAFETMYGKEYFVRLLGAGGYPATKQVRGSNFCDLGWHVDRRTGRVIVVSAIDNLMKGAAGQAVQNMNVVLGLDEKTGLDQVPVYP